MPETSSPPSSRRFSPTPVETTVKKSRRFVIEPVETTVRSNRNQDVQKGEDDVVEKKDFATKRRFVPEPVETSFKSSKTQMAKPLPTPEPTLVSIPQSPPPEETPRPRRRFTPELIETTKRSKRAGDSRPATLPTDKVKILNGLLFLVLWLTTSITPDRLNPRRAKYLYTPETKSYPISRRPW
jgi:hypothetical protein